MVKKTIFEGTVNGVKFDNVKEYNEYLMKLIETGKPVSASTKTTTIDEEVTNSDNNPFFKFPGFDETEPEYSYKNRMDSLTGSEMDNEILDNVNDHLDLVIDNVKTNIIDHMGKTDKLHYLGKVENIIDELKVNRCKTDSALKKLNNEIIILNQKLELLANGLALNDLYLTFYEDLKNVLVAKPENETCVNCNSKDCDGTCSCAQEDFGSLSIKDILKSLENLLKD